MSKYNIDYSFPGIVEINNDSSITDRVAFMLKIGFIAPVNKYNYSFIYSGSYYYFI